MFLNSAQWISRNKGETIRRPELQDLNPKMPSDFAERGSLFFRKTFNIEKEIQSASLESAGLGYYNITVNGMSPDPDMILAPNLADYFLGVKYNTFDVTGLLSQGLCSLAAEVGPGWFSGNPKYWGWQQGWYGNPRLIAALRIFYVDGTQETVITDDTWKLSSGSVITSCVYDGEEIDFSLEPNGWDTPDFDDSDWKNAVIIEAITDNLREQLAPPVRITQILDPIKTYPHPEKENVTCYDFGVNGAAIPYFTVKGAPGETITFNCAEFAYPDGTLDARSCGKALNTDVFHFCDDSVKICRPRFVNHGYRYCSATVSSSKVQIIRAQSGIVHSDVKTTGHFECSDEELNQLHEMYLRTQLACLLGVPVDCPQRQERKAWLGDMHATSELCLYNFDMRGLYEDVLEDMRLGQDSKNGTVQFICPCQGDYPPGSTIDWNLAYPIIMTETYERYGDLSLLSKHFSRLKKHTDFYVTSFENGTLPFSFYGDWFTLDHREGERLHSEEPGPEDNRQNPAYAAMLFLCQTLRLSARVAELTGHASDAQRYRSALDAVKKALVKRCFNAETGVFAGGGQFLQTYVLAEHIVPEESRQKVFNVLLQELAIHDYHPVVGVIGLRRLYETLCSFGRYDIAWKVFTVKGFPGQLHMLTNDRTTLTEGLDGDGSGCHTMFGSPDTVFYRMLGGITINRDCPTPLVIRPFCPEDLESVKCSQILEEGTVEVSWYHDGAAVVFDISVPEKFPALLDLNHNGKNIKIDAFTGTKRFVLA